MEFLEKGNLYGILIYLFKKKKKKLYRLKLYLDPICCRFGE